MKSAAPSPQNSLSTPSSYLTFFTPLAVPEYCLIIACLSPSSDVSSLWTGRGSLSSTAVSRHLLIEQDLLYVSAQYVLIERLNEYHSIIFAQLSLGCLVLFAYFDVLRGYLVVDIDLDIYIDTN